MKLGDDRIQAHAPTVGDYNRQRGLEMLSVYSVLQLCNLAGAKLGPAPFTA